MTELSQEILRDWQIRKTKAQKLRFIEFLQSRLPGLAVEEGGWPRCRNLVLGDPENADVIFTAHYDTCARLPFPNFITPKNLLIYLLYQLLILIPFFAAAGLLALVLIRIGVFGIAQHEVAAPGPSALLHRKTGQPALQEFYKAQLLCLRFAYLPVTQDLLGQFGHHKTPLYLLM